MHALGSDAIFRCERIQIKLNFFTGDKVKYIMGRMLRSDHVMAACDRSPWPSIPEPVSVHLPGFVLRRTRVARS